MRIIIYIGIILILSLVVGIFLCNTKNLPLKKDSISVVCTTGMIADAVKEIGKGRVEVYGLMGPGVDPHLYRARAGDMQKLSDADIIFYNGLHLEGKMTEVFSSIAAYKMVVPVTDAIETSKLRATEYQGIYDPHVWHDVSLWIDVVSYITKKLQAYDPAYADLYEKNNISYKNKLQLLHEDVRVSIKKIPKNKRILVTAHDAFFYFGAQYGLQVVGLQGLSTDSEIGVKDIQRLVDIIVTNNIPAIFIESSIPQRNVEAVQRAVFAYGKQVVIGDPLFSDALGDGTAATYIGMIQHNMTAICKSLCF